MSRDRSDRVLAVFARYPEPGRVKTRLAAQLGHVEACRIYERLLDRVIAEHRDRSYDLIFRVTPAGRADEFANRYGIAAEPQPESDLGAGMARTFRELLTRYETVAIAGSDIPRLTTGRVETAFLVAAHTDVVLGPGTDGGYYLVAARADPDIFTGIPWGTSGVLTATLARLEGLGLTWSLLPEEGDVDTAEDLVLME